LLHLLLTLDKTRGQVSAVALTDSTVLMSEQSVVWCRFD
jgi:hypothetical protein